MLQQDAAGAGAVQPPHVLSKSGYARHRDCSPAYISKLIRLGKLTRPALRDDGMVDVALADLQLAGQADPARQPELPTDEPAADTEPSFAQAKARRERAQAELAEIELAERKGEVVDRQTVFDAGFDLGALVRDKFAARRRELAQQLAGRGDVTDIMAVLEAADRKLCEDLANDAQQRLDALGADPAAAA